MPHLFAFRQVGHSLGRLGVHEAPLRGRRKVESTLSGWKRGVEGAIWGALALVAVEELEEGPGEQQPLRQRLGVRPVRRRRGLDLAAPWQGGAVSRSLAELLHRSAGTWALKAMGKQKADQGRVPCT